MSSTPFQVINTGNQPTPVALYDDANCALQLCANNGQNITMFVDACGEPGTCTANVIASAMGPRGLNGIPSQTKAGQYVYFSGGGIKSNGERTSMGSIAWEAEQDFENGKCGTSFSIYTKILNTEGYWKPFKIDENGDFWISEVKTVTLEDITVSTPEGPRTLRFLQGHLINSNVTP